MSNNRGGIRVTVATLVRRRIHQSYALRSTREHMRRLTGKALEIRLRITVVILYVAPSDQAGVVDYWSLLVAQVARKRAHASHYAGSIAEM